jgi:hypothetical protein
MESASTSGRSDMLDNRWKSAKGHGEIEWTGIVNGSNSIRRLSKKRLSDGDALYHSGTVSLAVKIMALQQSDQNSIRNSSTPESVLIENSPKGEETTQPTASVPRLIRLQESRKSRSYDHKLIETTLVESPEVGTNKSTSPRQLRRKPSAFQLKKNKF